MSPDADWKFVPAELDDFLSDKGHRQWAGDLTLERQAELIHGAVGLSGRNEDYLIDLVEHLRAEGIRDEGMERLLRMVEG